MDEVFRTIAEALRALTWLKWIDSDEGQLEDEDLAVGFPCALIDIQDADWDAGDVETQSGEVNIQVRFAYRKIENQSNTTSGANFDAALARIARQHEIDKAIIGLTGTNHGTITRINTAREQMMNGLKVFRTTYSCTISEDFTV